MATNLFDIAGKTALITGSRRGIGLTLARGLAEAGANVVLNARDKEALGKVVEELSSEGLSVCGYDFDVTDEKKIQESVQAIESEVGPICILINNAGITLRGKMEEIELETFEQVIDTNLTGVFCTSKIVARGMIERKRGKIINICSLQSELGRETTGPYAASKGGVKMLTKSMATEWAKHNIQVNGIGPGYLVTEMTQKLADDPEFNAWICGRTPANRWGDPKELIGAAIFLASEASNFVNGHILYVDGGILARL